jgi:hypothetical protein
MNFLAEACSKLTVDDKGKIDKKIKEKNLQIREYFVKIGLVLIFLLFFSF